MTAEVLAIIAQPVAAALLLAIMIWMVLKWLVGKWWA